MNGQTARCQCCGEVYEVRPSPNLRPANYPTHLFGVCILPDSVCEECQRPDESIYGHLMRRLEESEGSN